MRLPIKTKNKTDENDITANSNGDRPTDSGHIIGIEDVIMPMLGQLTRGDFTPFQAQPTTETGHIIEELRINIGKLVGRSQKMAEELQGASKIRSTMLNLEEIYEKSGFFIYPPLLALIK